MRRFFIQCIWNTSYNLPFFSKLKFVPSFNLIVWWEAAEIILSTCKIYVLINPTNMQKKENCLQINWIIIQSKFFFLFVGQEPTTWPANNCLQNNNGLLMRNAVNSVWLQMIFCSCVKETVLFSFLQSLLRENGRSLRFPRIFIKKTNLVI